MQDTPGTTCDNAICLLVSQKDYEYGKSHALQVIEQIPVPPSVVRETVEGYDVGWILKEALDLSVHEEKEEVEGFCGALTDVFGGEAGVCDSKDLTTITAGSQAAGEVLLLEPDHRCNLSEFECFLPTPFSKAPSPDDFDYPPLEDDPMNLASPFEQCCQGILEFFETIWAHREEITDQEGPYFELRGLKDNKDEAKRYSSLEGNHTFGELTDLIPEIVKQSVSDVFGKCTLFIGVNPRSSRSGGEIKDVACITTLHVEIDTGTGTSFRNTEEALEFVHTRIFKPCWINRTQKSLHLYFRLKQPFFTTNDQEREIAKGALKLLCREFKGDKSCNEISRVLRIPYTWHRKEIDSPFLVYPIPCPDAPAYSVKEIYEVLDNPEKATWGSRIPVPTKTSKLRRGTVRRELSPGYQCVLDDFPGPDGTGAHHKSYSLFRAMIRCGWSDEEIEAAFQERIENYPGLARREQWLKKLPERLEGLFKDLKAGKLKSRKPAAFKKGRLQRKGEKNPVDHVNLVTPMQGEALWAMADHAVGEAIAYHGPAIVVLAPGGGKSTQAMAKGLKHGTTKKILFCFENIDRIKECINGGMLDIACENVGAPKDHVTVILGRQDPACEDEFRRPFQCSLTPAERQRYSDMNVPMTQVCDCCLHQVKCREEGYLSRSKIHSKGLIITTRAKYLNERALRKGARHVFVDESMLPYFFRIRTLKTEFLDKFRNAVESVAVPEEFEGARDALLIILNGLSHHPFHEADFRGFLKDHLDEGMLSALKSFDRNPPWEERDDVPHFTKILADLIDSLLSDNGTRIVCDDHGVFSIKTPAPRREIRRIVSLDSTPIIPKCILTAYKIKTIGTPFCLPENVRIHAVSEEVGTLEDKNPDVQIVETVKAFVKVPQHYAMVRKLHEEHIVNEQPELQDQIGHYGLDERGTNAWKGGKNIFLDRYQTHLGHLQERTRDILTLLKSLGLKVDPLPEAPETRVWDAPFPGTEWECLDTPFFADPLLREIAKLDRNSFYFQALHRLRPMTRPGKIINVYLADARPVEGMRFDSVSTREEFADSLGVKLPKRPDQAALDAQNLGRKSKAEALRQKVYDLIKLPDGTIPEVSRERAVARAAELGCSERTLYRALKQVTVLTYGPNINIDSSVCQQDDGLGSGDYPGSTCKTRLPDSIPTHQEFVADILDSLTDNYGPQVQEEFAEKLSDSEKDQEWAEFSALQELVCAYEGMREY